jgi:amino acid permease
MSLAAVKVGPSSSFYTIADRTIPRFAVLVDIAVAIKCFGVGVAYMIVIGDLMPQAYEGFSSAPEEDTGVLENRQFWIGVFMILLVPLACLRNLDNLKYTSFAAVFFVIFLTVVVFLYNVTGLETCPRADGDDDGGDNDPEGNPEGYICKENAVAVTFNQTTISKLTIFIFAFTCHQNIFSICNELEDNKGKVGSIPRPDAVIGISLSIAAVVYSIVALFGYLTYGDLVGSNILTSYPDDNLTNLSRIFITLLVTFSYPLQTHPMRVCCLSMWKKISPQDESTLTRKYEFRYWTLTFLIVMSSFGLAMATDDLGDALAVVGATGSTIISYILPGLCYYYLFPEPHWKRTAAMVLVLLGCVIMPVALVVIFIDTD